MRRPRGRRIELPRGPEQDPNQPGAEYSSQACPSCGAAVHTGATFCHVCGAPLGGAPDGGGGVGPVVRRPGPGGSARRGERAATAAAASQVGPAVVVMWIVGGFNVLAGAWLFIVGWSMRRGIEAALRSGEPLDQEVLEFVQKLAMIVMVEGALALLAGTVFCVMAVRARRHPASSTLAAAVLYTVLLLLLVGARVSMGIPLHPIGMGLAILICLVLWSGYAGARSYEARARRIQARERREGGGGPPRRSRRRIV